MVEQRAVNALVASSNLALGANLVRGSSDPPSSEAAARRPVSKISQQVGTPEIRGTLTGVSFDFIVFPSPRVIPDRDRGTQNPMKNKKKITPLLAKEGRGEVSIYCALAQFRPRGRVIA